MSSWNEFKVSELAHVNKSVVDKNYPHNEILYLDVASTNQGKVTELQSLKLKEAPSRAKRILTNNDFVISTVRPNLKHYAFIKEVTPNTVASTGYAVVTAKEEVCDPRFLYYLLTTQEYTDYLTRIADGHTSTYPSFNPSVIENTLVKIPNLNIQKKISDTLGNLDDKIDLNNRINETLESMAKAIFKEWFIDFGPVKAKAEGRKPFGMDDETAALFPDSFEDSELGQIPKGWKTSAIYDLADWQNGMAFKACHFSDTGLPIIKIAELKSGIIAGTKKTDQQHEEKFRIRDGEILFSWSGSPDTSIDTFIWDKGDAWLNQHIFKVKAKETGRSFVYSLLKHMKPVFVETAKNKQTTGLGHITVADLKRLQSVIPTPEVIASFNRIIEPILTKYFLNLKESLSLIETRDLLLPKLISGEIQFSEVASD